MKNDCNIFTCVANVHALYMAYHDRDISICKKQLILTYHKTIITKARDSDRVHIVSENF